MPPKKNTGSQKSVAAVSGGGDCSLSASMLLESTDPMQIAVNIIDKKARNLEKRKNKLTTLKESLQHGSTLERDQQEAVQKLGDVMVQLELVREFQKQFSSISVEYEKVHKRQQKIAKQTARDAERDAQKRAVQYTLRLQDILNSMGEADKENFRNGENGAVELSEESLDHLDDLYKVLNPTRVDNPSFSSDLNSASECVLQLNEQSSREVFGTTYKQLHSMIKSVDECGYFDRVRDEQEEEDDGDYTEAQEHLTVADQTPADGGVEYSEEDIVHAGSTLHDDSLNDQFLPPSGGVGDVHVTGMEERHYDVMGDSNVIAQTNMSYMPSAPSPQFPGLGASPIQPTLDDGFSFMHDSEVDRSQVYQQPHLVPVTASQVTQAPQTITPPPQQDYPQYSSGELPSTGGADIAIQLATTSLQQHTGNQTDVATGQPSPTVQDSGQHVSGSAGSGQTYPQDYQRQQYQSGGNLNNRGWQQGGQNRRSGGPGGWSGTSKGNVGGAYRNGRNNQGGNKGGSYDGYQGSYQNSRSYQGNQGKGGGRPNYKTTGGVGSGQRR